MTTQFRLTPQEDFVRGVSLRDTTLRFAASGTQVIEAGILTFAALVAAIGSVITAAGAPTTLNGFEVDHPLPVAIAFAVVACGLLAQAFAALRSGVVATPDGLAVRDHWRWRSLSWDHIVDVQALDTSHERWAGFVGPGVGGLWMRPVAAHSLGVAVTADGTVVALPSFYAAARGEGLSMGGPTPTELKVAALRRYREDLVGPWPGPSRTVTVDQLEQAGSMAPAALLAVLAPPALWAVLELASDDHIGLGVLVVAWLGAAALFAWNNRRRLSAALRGR